MSALSKEKGVNFALKIRSFDVTPQRKKLKVNLRGGVGWGDKVAEKCAVAASPRSHKSTKIIEYTSPSLVGLL